MSVLEREPERGGRGRNKKNSRQPNFPTNFSGHGELVGQGGVTQQSAFQDFQRMTAPFSAEKEAFTGS